MVPWSPCHHSLRCIHLGCQRFSPSVSCVSRIIRHNQKGYKLTKAPNRGAMPATSIAWPANHTGPHHPLLSELYTHPSPQARVDRPLALTRDAHRPANHAAHPSDHRLDLEREARQDRPGPYPPNSRRAATAFTTAKPPEGRHVAAPLRARGPLPCRSGSTC